MAGVLTERVVAGQDPTSPVGRYQLRRRIRRDVLADLVLAHDQGSDRQAVLWVLHPELTTEPSFAERFDRAVEPTAGLAHPNIVTVRDWGKIRSTYYLITDHVSGPTVSRLLAEEDGPDPTRAAEIAADVAAALGAAHRQGVVHGDLTPERIWMAPDGTAKVAGFGIAQAVRPEASVGPHDDLRALGALMQAMVSSTGLDAGPGYDAIATKLLRAGNSNGYATADEARQDLEATAETRRSRSLLIGAGFLLALGLPLVIALVAALSPRWFPVLDLAQIEMRLRDVGSSDPPLLGPIGRIGSGAELGSHPGPLSFYAMWPIYWLLGSSSWAMQAASVWVHLVAMGLILWICHRRGRLPLLVGGAATTAILAAAYGPWLLTQAWNPHLCVLWWVVFLLAVWSVTCGDAPLLPVVAIAGSFCAQAHIGYLGLVGGLTVVALVSAAVQARRRRRHAAHQASYRWSRWSLLAAGVGLLLWVPPIIDQFTAPTGNLTVLWEHANHPDEPPVGFGEAAETLLVHLDPWTLLSSQVVWDPTQADGGDIGTVGGSLVPGILLLIGWATSVVAAWRMRHRPLLRFHLVLAVVLLLSLWSISRIFGPVWYYFVLWAWGINALMVLAVGWTAAEWVARHRPAARWSAPHVAAKVAVLGVIAVSTALFANEARTMEISTPTVSRSLGELVDPTVEALSDGSVRGGGRDGSYLVTWGDPVFLGAQGWGLANELHRAGFDVGTEGIYHGRRMRYRRMTPAEATAEVHLSVGSDDIAKWRMKPDAVEVAFFDPRTPEESAEHLRLKAVVARELEAAGLGDRVPTLENFTLAFDPAVPPKIRNKIGRMLELQPPVAVFVTRPER